MAKDPNETTANQNSANALPDYSNLPRVSQVLKASDAGEITYKVDDIANRELIMLSASMEAGNFGSYAKMEIFDPATREKKMVTNGSNIIMTQVNTLITHNVFPCRVKFTKQGKTWICQ